MTSTTDTSADIDSGLAEFVAAARQFLDSRLRPKDKKRPFVWGEGSDDVAFFEQVSAEAEASSVAAAQSYCADRFDAGFGWITGPVELGGRALPGVYAERFAELEDEYEHPVMSWFAMSHGMVGPTIVAHGNDALRERYARRLFRGDLIACQLFSEPGAGSDLAGVQTKAVRDGDEWVITGQKVWTSVAQHSDLGEILTRTDPSQPKHQGITAFVLDMNLPGVEVRPLRQMTGGASFNEVFLNEVRVRDDHRLGDVNAGWRVAITTLMNERAGVGQGDDTGAGRLVVRLIEMARQLGRRDDPVIRQGLADVVSRFRIAQWTHDRGIAALNGRTPGPERSMDKLAYALNWTALTEVAAEILGPKLVADTGEWGTYAWNESLLGAPAGHIGGGTDEIIRNILGERVLGLPKDPGT